MESPKTKLIPPSVHLRYLPEIKREDAEVIFEFFMVFSRFEFALKQLGYRNMDRGYLMLEWDRFAKSIQDKFNPNKSLDLFEAYEYYLHNPPKIQTLVNEHLKWKPNRKKDEETDFVWVIHSIGIVRNNLFHGGKFPWDQTRDVTLLAHGLIILYECLELDEKFFYVFNSSQ